MIKKIRATFYLIIENILGRELTKPERTAIRKALVIYAELARETKN